VFDNRLRMGMKLDCDPTTIYAAILEQRYRGTIYRSDLQSVNQYNTYQHAGLPPGPIANPGEAALRAALDPPPTDDLYFVANTQGGHFFSKTLKEHNQNVARYRHLLEDLRNPSADGPPPATAPALTKSRPVRTSP
jgi:UPF0755 protein